MRYGHWGAIFSLVFASCTTEIVDSLESADLAAKKHPSSCAVPIAHFATVHGLLRSYANASEEFQSTLQLIADGDQSPGVLLTLTRRLRTLASHRFALDKFFSDLTDEDFDAFFSELYLAKNEVRNGSTDFRYAARSELLQKLLRLQPQLGLRINPKIPFVDFEMRQHVIFGDWKNQKGTLAWPPIPQEDLWHGRGGHTLEAFLDNVIESQKYEVWIHKIDSTNGSIDTTIYPKKDVSIPGFSNGQHTLFGPNAALGLIEDVIANRLEQVNTGLANSPGGSVPTFNNVSLNGQTCNGNGCAGEGEIYFTDYITGHNYKVQFGFKWEKGTLTKKPRILRLVSYYPVLKNGSILEFNPPIKLWPLN